MANNMIALQARAPQTNFIGNAVQQNAQMINMMRQQDAAERQAATAAKNAELAAAQEGRAAAKDAREASAAELELAGKKIDYYTKLAGQTLNAAGYQRLLGQLDKDAPEIAEAFRTNLPPEQFDRNLLLQMVGSVGDNFKATYGPLETEVVLDADGNYGVATTGGFSAERGQQGVTPLNVLTPKKAGAPAPGGVAPAAGNLKATRGVNTGPRDVQAQLDAAAQAVARGAGVNDPALRNLNENDFLEVQKRASRLMQNSPEFQQMSMTGGAQAQPDLGGIVQQMMQTGVVSQSNLQALRAAAGPDKEQQLAQLLRASNVQIMPDEQPAGGMRDAAFRPEEGMPTMQRTQGMVQYEDTGRQFRGKSPMVGPLPGSSQVPIPRVREEAKAQRKTPQETYEETRSTKQAESDVKFLEGLGAARESAQTALGVINSMIGDARLSKAGQIEIPRGGRTPHPGFEDVIGATWRPGARFVPGTNAAGFDAYLDQVEGGAFLEAYERLKGTGQITEVEGKKATSAITRMKRSVSEVEFVKAAREFQGVIQSALTRAEQREAKLKGIAPAGGGRRTPIQKGGPKELRFNPVTGDFE